ncbi:MAG: serine/threonine-protein phosphatase, partial [Leptospira sp.]|nr:serine/threonine-protein phosphatase [Leptospira sp.]
ITMAVKNEYDNIKYSDSPAILFDILNKKFTKKFKSVNALFSSIVVDIHLDKNEIVYSSAGHPDQYLIQNNSIIALEKTGRIIGLTDNTIYSEKTLSIQPKDRLFLFSDGIYERFNPDKEEFGEERFRHLLQEKCNLELNRIYSVLEAKINQFCEGKPPDDDISYIAVEF